MPQIHRVAAGKEWYIMTFNFLYSCGMVVHTTQVSSGHPKMGLIRLDTIFALTFLSLQVKLFMFLMALLHCYCCSDIW